MPDLPDATVQRLIAAIEDSFPDAEPPPYDKGLNHLLPEDAAVFRRTRWPAIVSARLPYDAVYFFSSDEAFRYYLPAMMVTVLRWPRRAANLMTAVLTMLDPPRRTDPEHASFFVRMDAFTPEQKRAVRDFLVYLDERCSESKAPHALRVYWRSAAPEGR
jgi:hypothetical protein